MGFVINLARFGIEMPFTADIQESIGILQEIGHTIVSLRPGHLQGQRTLGVVREQAQGTVFRNRRAAYTQPVLIHAIHIHSVRNNPQDG